MELLILLLLSTVLFTYVTGVKMGNELEQSNEEIYTKYKKPNFMIYRAKEYRFIFNIVIPGNFSNIKSPKAIKLIKIYRVLFILELIFVLSLMFIMSNR